MKLGPSDEPTVHFVDAPDESRGRAADVTPENSITIKYC
jgi:hypothetical protein